MEPVQVIIKVVGIGGAGCNALEAMISRKLPGVQTIAVNTDAQALARSTADKIIRLGGRSAIVGMNPAAACELVLEYRQPLADALRGASMVFIAAGLGGHSGTGIAPVIARIAKAQGALTIGIVYAPFPFEGGRCQEVARDGLQILAQDTDSLFVIPPASLDGVDGDKCMSEILHGRDMMLYETVSIFAQLFAQTDNFGPSLLDLKKVMGKQGRALTGMGTASGIDRTRIATGRARDAILSHGIDMSAARGLLAIITVSSNSRLVKLKTIKETAGFYTIPGETSVMGIVFDESMRDAVKVCLIVTGI